MLKKVFAGIVATCTVLAMGVTMVYAGTTYESYSTTVGRVNGSGYTDYQSKTTNGANGDLSSTYVGGDYTVDARMQEDDGTAGAWTRDVDDNERRDLDGHVDHKAWDSVRVQFSNDFFTFVNVQVKGKWRSN